MTKKDYELIARAIKDSEPTEEEHDQGTATTGWLKTANLIAIQLQEENHKFDIRKFLLACGVITK